jgi:Holliday junction resolvasome RuvABC endonuclease subunit
VSPLELAAAAAPEAAATDPRPRVCGIDPSLTGTGIASTLGWCELTGRNGITTMPIWDRTDAINALAHHIVDLAGHPHLAVIEQPAAAKAYGGASERAGLFWEITRLLRARGIPIAEVTPSQLKLYATGKGQCPKEMVVDAVARRWPAYETSGNNNLCDAIVLAAMGADTLGAPLTAVPAAHRKALAKVTWPEVVAA